MVTAAETNILSMKILFCGDLMPGGVLPYQGQYIDQHLLTFLKSYDCRIGTLECAVGTSDMPFDEVKMKGRQNIIYAREDDFFRVKEMGFDVVSLANNHVLDLSEEGLINTIRLLNDNGIKYCGAGLDIEEASRPALIEKDGLSVAVLAYCMYGNKYLGHVKLAGKNEPGVNPLDVDKVVRDVSEAKKKYDKVIVMPHWGREYRYDPMPECLAIAKQIVQAGADAILGSHPHQIQPLVKYRGKPICYSMGNFLFPDFYMRPPRPIWYPARDGNTYSVKKVVGYPFPIEEPMLQVWNPLSRYGCVVSMELNGKDVDTMDYYVHLSDDNVLSLSELPADMQNRLFKNSLMAKYTTFRFMSRMKKRLLG